MATYKFVSWMPSGSSPVVYECRLPFDSVYVHQDGAQPEAGEWLLTCNRLHFYHHRLGAKTAPEACREGVELVVAALNTISTELKLAAAEMT